MTRLNEKPTIVYLFGVTACGKSTVGKVLAGSVLQNATYLDADTYHSTENKSKMSCGVSLSDEDRRPWLERVRDAATAECLTSATPTSTSSRPRTVVVACSALRRSYRDILRSSSSSSSSSSVETRFVHLVGSRNAVEARFKARMAEAARNGDRDHFMNDVRIVDDQFATLEPAAAGENAITIGTSTSTSEETDRNPAEVAEEIKSRLSDEGPTLIDVSQIPPGFFRNIPVRNLVQRPEPVPNPTM